MKCWCGMDCFTALHRSLVPLEGYWLVGWHRSELAGTTDGRGSSSVSHHQSLIVGQCGRADLTVVEGAMTVTFGIICFFFMPDTPAAAGFLNDEEKEWALRRMRLDAHGSTVVDVDDEKASWYWVKMALKAPQTYFCSFIWFFLLVPLYVRHS